MHSYSYSLHTTQTHINTHTPEDAILLLGFTIAFGQLKASCYGEGVDKMSPAALTCLDNKLELGLWVASGVYIAHGLAEMILGPYLVLPLFGPSNFRDGIGMLADSRMNLAYYIWAKDQSNYDYAGALAVNAINNLSLDKDTYEGVKQDALDPYLFVRDAFAQYRQNLIDN